MNTYFKNGIDKNKKNTTNKNKQKQTETKTKRTKQKHIKQPTYNTKQQT